MTATIPESYDDGFYNLSFMVVSTHDYVITRTLLSRGANNDVEWRWINSTNSEELFNNTNWTKIDFNDTDWSDGKTPFGDENLNGIEYQTFWEGDNYAYFRHIFYIDDPSDYEWGLCFW